MQMLFKLLGKTMLRWRVSCAIGWFAWPCGCAQWRRTDIISRGVLKSLLFNYIQCRGNVTTFSHIQSRVMSYEAKSSWWIRTSPARWLEFGSLSPCSLPSASSTQWRTCSSSQLDCSQVPAAFDFSRHCIWVFPKIGVPQNGWFIMKNPIKMDDLGGPPLFLETPIWIVISAVTRCTTELGWHFGEELDPSDHWQCHCWCFRILLSERRKWIRVLGDLRAAFVCMQ